MLLLGVLGFGLLCITIVLVVTQIAIPVIGDTPLFPAFRANKLRDQVEDTAAEVDQMKEQNKNLHELASLKAQKAALEKVIAAVENPVTTETKVNK